MTNLRPQPSSGALLATNRKVGRGTGLSVKAGRRALVPAGEMRRLAPVPIPKNFNKFPGVL